MWFGFSIPTVILSPQSLTGSWRLPLVACQLARVCRGLWLSRSSSREAVVTYRPPITPLTGYKHARSPPPLPPLRLCWGLVLYGHSDQQPTGHDVGATQIVEEKANWILSSENIGAEPGCRRWTGQGPGGCRNKTNLCHYPRFHRLMEVAPHRLSITPPKTKNTTKKTKTPPKTTPVINNTTKKLLKLPTLVTTHDIHKYYYNRGDFSPRSYKSMWKKLDIWTRAVVCFEIELQSLSAKGIIPAKWLTQNYSWSSQWPAHLLVEYLLFSQKKFQLVRPSLIWPISED